MLKWTELDGWSKKYDVEQIAREVKTDDWALFLRVLDETKAFAEAVEAPEVLRLTAGQQILIGELIADHVVPTISRLEPGLVSFHLAVLLVGDE